LNEDPNTASTLNREKVMYATRKNPRTPPRVGCLLIGAIASLLVNQALAAPVSAPHDRDGVAVADAASTVIVAGDSMDDDVIIRTVSTGSGWTTDPQIVTEYTVLDESGAIAAATPATAKVYIAPYPSCHSWGFETYSLDDEIHKCNRLSGSIGTYAGAWAGAATSEATQRVSFYTGTRKVLQIEAEISRLGGIVNYGFGAWAGTDKTRHVGSWENETKIAVDFAFAPDIVLEKAISLALLVAPPSGPEYQSLREAIEAIDLMMNYYSLLSAMADLISAGDGETLKMRFSYTADPGYHDVWVGLRSNASAVLTGSGFAFSMGQVKSVTIDGIAPPTKPTVGENGQAYIGVPHMFFFSSTDPNGDKIRYEIIWGDGARDTTELVLSGRKAFMEHTYASGGPWVITVTAEDSDLEDSLSSTTYNVSPTTAPPQGNLYLKDLWLSTQPGDTSHAYEIDFPAPNQKVYFHFEYGWIHTEGNPCNTNHNVRIKLNGVQQCAFINSGIASGSSAVISCGLNASWSGNVGSYTVLAEVDYNDDVYEMSESDNSMDLTFSVLAPEAVNDECLHASSIGNETVESSTQYCTNDGNASCGNSSYAPDAWYVYQATCTGYLEADTIDSDLDTVLSVHNTCTNSASSEYGCNDDRTTNDTASYVVVPVEQNRSYLLRVAGYGSEKGDYVLSTSCTAISTPQVNAWNPTNVGITSATFQGYLVSDGRNIWGVSSGEACEVAFRFREQPTDPWMYTKWQSSYYQEQSFDQQVGGFDPSTTYYYQAVARNRAGEVASSTKSFTTVARPSVYVDTTSLSVTTIEEQSTPNRSFVVYNSGGDTLEYTVTIPNAPGWISVDTLNGDSTGSGDQDTVQVIFTTSTLTPGNYSATIFVSDAEATNSPRSISVSLRVNPKPRPAISVTPAKLWPTSFPPVSGLQLGGIRAGDNAFPQTITLTNSGTASGNFAVGETSPWLSCSPANPTLGAGASTTITVTYTTSALPGGWHYADISISCPEAKPTQVQVVKVSLNVYDLQGLYNALTTGMTEPGGAGVVEHGDDIHLSTGGMVAASGTGGDIVMTAFGYHWFNTGAPDVYALVRFYRNDAADTLLGPTHDLLVQYPVAAYGTGFQYTRVEVDPIQITPDVWMTVHSFTPDASLVLAEQYGTAGFSHWTYLNADDPDNWMLEEFGPPPTGPPGNFAFDIEGFVEETDIPPTAIPGGPYEGVTGSEIVFDASASFDADGSVVGYMWDFDGDGLWDTEWLEKRSATHRYPFAYFGDVQLQIVDDRGETAVEFAPVMIHEAGNEAPAPNAGGPYWGAIGEVITLDASGSYDQDASGAIVGYMWDFTDDGTWDTGWLPDATIDHAYQAEFHGQVKVRVTDDGGATADASTNVDIEGALMAPRGLEVTGSCSGAGACCDPTAGTCLDGIEPADCPPPMRHHSNRTCGELEPPCGLALPCEHTITLWDDWGDGWNGGTLDVYVDGELVLDGVALASGTGPEIVQFAAYDFSEIRTEWHGVGWSYEASYCVNDAAGGAIACDGVGGSEPGGLTENGSCAEPGACCDGEAWLCYDGIMPADCQEPMRFYPYQACATLDPPCGMQICEHSLVLIDAGGDGWNDGVVDVYVNGELVLGAITLAEGGGPEVWYFSAETGDEITTVWTPGTRPYECSYCLYDSYGRELGCDPVVLNRAPQADAGGPYSAPAGLEVTFDASASSDPDGSVDLYRWDWDNDGVWDSDYYAEPFASHTYYAAFVGDARVQIVDDDGAAATALASVTITANELPVADAGGPYEVLLNTQIDFDASASHDPDGSITGYRWDWNNDGVWDTGWLEQPTTAHTYTEVYTGKVALEVRDDDGVTTTGTTPTNSDNDSDGDGVLDYRDQCEGFDDALDCDADGVPDGCEVDANENGIPDDCECSLAPSPTRPLDDQPKNRYLSIVPATTGTETAIRVTIVSADGYPEADGRMLWVGPPDDYPEENSAQPNLTFVGAPLVCEPYFQVWDGIEVLHVFGAEIVPNSIYEVHTIDSTCASQIGQGFDFGVPLGMTTGTWGDVAPLYADPQNPPQPDFNDISALVQKFLAAPTAPIKAAAQLQPNVVFPDRAIDFRDIAADVSAFLSRPYNDMYVGPCTCPPSVPCNVTPCVNDVPCCGGLCVQGFCADACGRCAP